MYVNYTSLRLNHKKKRNPKKTKPVIKEKFIEMKELYLYIKKVSWVSGIIDLKFWTLWHNLVKLLQFKNKDKNSQGLHTKKPK